MCRQSENSRAWRSLRRPARLNVQQQACAPGKKHLSWRLLEKEAFAVGKPDLEERHTVDRKVDLGTKSRGPWIS